MKKMTLIAAATALLLSGGVFIKANQQNIGVLANELLLENLTAFSDPAPRSGFVVTGRWCSGTCGVGIGNSGICCISYTDAQGIYQSKREERTDVHWCCDSCHSTAYCGSASCE